MLCQKCGKNNANVKIVKNYNGNIEELYLCSLCANEEEMNIDKNFYNDTIFGNLFNIFTPLSVSEVICDKCKTSYSEFKANGKFGCSECFSKFEKYLDPLFKNIHGATSHTGKLNKSCEAPLKIKKEEENLKLRLKQAISEENYEEAARLRDEIRRIEGVE